MKTNFATAVLAATCLLSASAFAAPKSNPQSNDSKTPATGVQPSGSDSGAKPMNEGQEAGAPGNIVTTVESASMKSHDKDGNGSINAAEAAQDPGLKKQFAKLDVNHDGKLDAAEFAKFEPATSAVTGSSPTEPPAPGPVP